MNYLLGFDFDGTIAQTFEKSPKGIGVTEAYRLAISDIFGPEVLAIYDTQGGLKNSAPSELIHSLMGEGGNELLVRNAEQFFNTHKEELINLGPRGERCSFGMDTCATGKNNGRITCPTKASLLNGRNWNSVF